MSTELLSMLQRRQAIERGLSHYMHGSILERVLNYWEIEYGNQPSFVLNRFLNEICNTDELRLHRKDMLKHVLFELSQIEKQELLKSKKKQPAIVDMPISGDLTNAFSQFIQLVVQHIVPTDMADFTTDVQQHLVALNLPVDMSQGIAAPRFIDLLPITSYANILTTVYEVYCDFYGPTKADHVYALAKNKIKAQYPDVDLHQLL